MIIRYETIGPIFEMAPQNVDYYGISIAGVAKLFDLNSFCPKST
ncbi:MAG: hypothetical protein ACNYWM_02040 [Methanosarcinales archaeon]